MRAELLLAVACLYGGGTLGVLLGRCPRASRALLVVGFVVHLHALLQAGDLTRLPHFLSLLSLCLMGGLLGFDLLYTGSAALLASPLPLALLLISAAVPSRPFPLPHSFAGWLPLHVVPCLLGEATLGLAFCVGVLFLLLERELRGRRLGRLYRMLPSLESLDSWNGALLITGFGLLSVGMAVGLGWARRSWHPGWIWDPKIMSSVVSWAVYALLLGGRTWGSWRGHRAAVGSVLGFLFVLFAMLGASLLFPGPHSFARWSSPWRA